MFQKPERHKYHTFKIHFVKDFDTLDTWEFAQFINFCQFPIFSPDFEKYGIILISISRTRQGVKFAYLKILEKTLFLRATFPWEEILFPVNVTWLGCLQPTSCGQIYCLMQHAWMEEHLERYINVNVIFRDILIHFPLIRLMEDC